ncbi:MAG: hypothetical protein ACRCTI_16940, partial [Beijerinckiaceae bacterium]
TFRPIATRCLTAAALLWTMPGIAVRPGWAGELREPPDAATAGAADEAVGRRGSDPYAYYVFDRRDEAQEPLHSVPPAASPCGDGCPVGSSSRAQKAIAESSIR